MPESNPIKIKAPSSKSLSHRALICASLAQGTSTILDLLQSDDIKRTMDCLQRLGVKITTSNSKVEVEGKGRNFCFEQPIELYGGESGTTFRLITGLLCGAKGQFTFVPKGQMAKRPMDGIEQAVKSTGSQFTYLKNPKCPPFVLSSLGLSGDELTVSLEQSSQYLSGLILGSVLSPKPVTIYIGGKKVLSWPYVGLTLQVLKHFGGKFEVEQKTDRGWETIDFTKLTQITPGKVRFIIYPGPLVAREFRVEGDFSNASYLLACGVLGTRPILVQNLNPNSLQGDVAILSILGQMQAKIKILDTGVLVEPSSLRGLEVDMGLCPDLVPTVAVLASLAKGKTIIKNVAHLRIKESDRLQAMANEIAKTGTKIEVLPDGLKIEPAEQLEQPVSFTTYDDHRVAMSLSLYSLKGLKVNLDNPGCVSKSFPDFFTVLDQILKAQN